MKRVLVSLFLIMGLGSSLFSKEKVACIGDSVTYGDKIEERERLSYPAQLQTFLGESYEVRNFGHNGATLLRHGHRPYNTLPEYKEALEYKPDLLIIHLGLNDTDPRNWPNWGDEFIGDYKALVSDFRKANPKVKIWICKLTPIFHGHKRFLSGTRDWHSEIQKRIESVAASEGTGLIDLYSPLVIRPDLFADNLHPSAEGAGIIAKSVYGALTGDFGGIKLSPLYSDGMVLQRGKEIRISGTADRSEEIKIELMQISGRGKKTKENVICRADGTAGQDGRWTVKLPPLEAGGPYVLNIGNLKFNDVWVGELWVCAGQSNMEFKLKDCDSAADDLSKAASRKDIHIFHMKPRWETSNSQWSADALSEVNKLNYYAFEGWKSGDPSAAGEVSAIGYHFAKVLADSLHCHVGIISCAVGGSTTESWCNRELLQWQMPLIMYDWYHGDFGQKWARERAMTNIANSENPDLQRHPYETGYLFDSAIRAIDRFPIKGLVWYQGESNAHNIELHEKLFPIAVESWRKYWGEDFRIETIQISAMERPSWPRFRNSQRILANRVSDAGMTVCSDLGNRNDVHPKAKKAVGERAAWSALYHVYGRKDIIPSGPIYKNFVIERDALRLFFDWDKRMTVSGGFEIAGTDGIYHPAKAEVCEHSIIVRSSEVSNPVAVRYAWKAFPEDADLRNAAGLPASTFCDEHLLWQ